MIRIGLAGLGFMGHTHLMNYLKYPHAEVVALADLRENRRKGPPHGHDHGAPRGDHAPRPYRGKPKGRR